MRCSLSRRQAQLYAALRKRLTLADLLSMGMAQAAASAAASASAAAQGKGGAGMSRLMGLIMQMRKARAGAVLHA